MNVVFSFDDLCIDLCQQLVVRLACDLVQRLYLLLEQQAGCVKIFLDVIEAQDFLNGPILELDLVVDLTSRLLLFLDGLLDDFYSCLLLLR